MKEVENYEQELDDIEKQIVQTLEKITKGNTDDTTWVTNEIKKRIGDIGFKQNYEVSSSAHDGEWLYDLVWYKKGQDGLKGKVILVLESEISDRTTGGLMWDFEKLLIANTEYKVMICMANGNYDFPNNVNDLLPIFDKAVKTNQNISSGSRVLVLIWEDYETGEVYPHLIIKK